MKTETISVTEAARNFSDCVNRVRYQGTTFVLEKNGTPVARIVPEEPKPKTGKELALALREVLKDAHLGEEEAEIWRRELDEARKKVIPPVDKWRS